MWEESDVLSGDLLGSTFGSDLDVGKKGGSYKIDVDSRVPCGTRGFSRVTCRGPGDTRVGAGEVVDVWKELLKL
uniref:Uncharacterized protein n=1 Tax=Meloidogyne enterolobii TaxID=390850 RepID=A0A6V7W507_MELEN|nr:unnamed protein product [Meloidogyne enterolobii]